MLLEIPYNKLIIGNTYNCTFYNEILQLKIIDRYKIGEIIFVRTDKGPSHFQVFPDSTCKFFPLDQLNNTQKYFNYNQKPSYVYKLDL